MAHKSGRRKRDDPEPAAPSEDEDEDEGVNLEARRLLIEIVDNQLRDNDPPETRDTYTRLMRDGHSSDEAKRLIAFVLLIETTEMLRVKRTFDEAHYVADLRNLPTLPDDD